MKCNKSYLIIILTIAGYIATPFTMASGRTEPAIVAHIIEADTTTVIEMPDALSERLNYEEPKTDENVGRPRNGMAGYRVQVFSDNNQRTAKNEARSKSRSIGSRFPKYRTYVSYTSPYWRLRVGDFRTRQEATAAADELREAFPSYSKEIRVVRDRINL